MQIEKFTPELIRNYKMFYILQHLNSDIEDFMLYCQEVSATSAFYDFDLFEMNDKKVLLAFPDPFKYSNIYNLVATDGNISEIVPMQPFERIWSYYDKPTDSTEGFFVFMNSIPMALDGLDWRCDNAKYGPLGYNVGLDMSEPMLKTLDQIVVYEPIMSINSIGHLVYAHVIIPEEIEEYFINGNPIPFYGRTLSEVFKQLVEWSVVTESPFNNTQEMALDSKNFLEQIYFDNSYVSNQVDMQIFEYLKGNTNARQRPEGVESNSEELKMFIKKNSSYGTLSALLSLYPTAWDAGSIIEEDRTRIQKDLEDFVTAFVPENMDKSVSNSDNLLAYILSNATLDGLKIFAKIKINFIKKQIELLDRLELSINPDF
jgi:hypothetical protein